MAIAYYNPHTNEPVEKEAWKWVVLYQDGTGLEQFALEPGQGAVFHPFADIQIDKVKRFSLIHDTCAPIIIYPPEGAKLVHGYTTRKAQHLTDDGEFMFEETYRGYKFGYQLNGNDYGVFVDYDNSVQILSNFQSVLVAPDKI